jgi:hypothetical protein
MAACLVEPLPKLSSHRLGVASFGRWYVRPRIGCEAFFHLLNLVYPNLVQKSIFLTPTPIGVLGAGALL